MESASGEWNWDARMGFWRIGEASDRRVVEIRPPEGRASQLSCEDLEALLRTLNAPAREAS